MKYSTTIFLFSLVLFSVSSGAADYRRAKVISVDIEEEFQFNKPWYKPLWTEEQNLKQLIKVIEQTKTGKQIIAKATMKAYEKGETLMDVLRIGEGSLTDTTLTRKFKADDPTKVIYETHSKVYVNKNLNLLDASLDLAHELTHFSFREYFNPYVPKFSMKEFISSTVEGKGGEVDAFLIECKVYDELKVTKNVSRSTCTRIKDENSGELSREKGIQEFYRVGQHYEDFYKNIEKYKYQKADFPKVSNAEAQFISSAWGVPYPLAAFREYVNIMDRVCKNDYNRLALLQKKLGRAPASDNDFQSTLTNPDSVNTVSSMYQLMSQDFKGRCQNFPQIP